VPCPWRAGQDNVNNDSLYFKLLDIPVKIKIKFHGKRFGSIPKVTVLTTVGVDGGLGTEGKEKVLLSG